MKTQRRNILMAGTALATMPAWSATSQFPNKPISLVVPFSKGGSTDIVARIIAPALSKVLGTPIDIKNVSGAGGTVGAQALATAPGDGYTLGMATVSTTGTGPIVRRTIGYDPLEDFAPVMKLVDVPGVISVHPSFPADNFEQFIEVVRRNPGRYSYASSGLGGVQHMGMELFKIRNRLYLLHMPYRGAGPALKDVVAGKIEVMWDNLSSSLPLIQAGKLRPIGLVSSKRSPRLPDLPTFAELGVKNYHASTYFGVLAPSSMGMTKKAVLADALEMVMAEPVVQNALTAAGGSLVGGSPKVLHGQILHELGKWGEVANYAKIRI